jgi:hypothetical protein
VFSHDFDNNSRDLTDLFKVIEGRLIYTLNWLQLSLFIILWKNPFCKPLLFEWEGREIFLIILIGDFFHLEKPQVPAPPPQRQLPCRGQVCPKCGQCRDWYYDNGWKRRNVATCTYNAVRGFFVRGFFVHVCSCE